MVRQYELYLVLRPDFDYEKPSSREELVAKLLGSDYITIKDIQVGGKKHLSYPMKKQEEGIEMVVQFEGVKVIVGEIEKRVKLGTDVLRFLLTVKPA